MPERKTLKEFRHELNLSLDRHVVVEGYSDRNFYSAWLDAHDALDGISVQVVGTIEIGNSLLEELNLPDAERSRVIALASVSQEYSRNLLCIADRDTGNDVNRFNYDSLLWTDYPALESYILHPKLFRIAHRMCFQGRLKDSESLLAELSSALFKLWQVRLKNPHLPSPNYKRGVKSGGGLDGFDPFAATTSAGGVDASALNEEPPADARVYAYGHDVAALLFAAYSNKIKNSLKIPSVEVLEKMMCSVVVSSPELATESLFRRLYGWATRDADGASDDRN